MMKKLITSFALVFSAIFHADAQVQYLPEDTVVFNRFLQYSKQGDHSVIRIANFFLEAPYVGGTLEGEGDERLRVNLRELDCVTLLENVIALRLMLQSDSHTFDNFCRILQTIRYRDGNIDGYLSRLHYFSDWLDNSRKNGIINLPENPLCRSFTPGISYMSANCNLYPALRNNPELCNRMSAIEKNVNELRFCYVPKENVKDLGAHIQNGDIIAITTHINGLDVSHTGFAMIKNRTAYLLHASTEARKVTLSEETLHDYLARMRNNSGIIIGRLVK